MKACPSSLRTLCAGLAAAALLSACGGGSDGPAATPVTTTISGSVVKGPVTGANVCAYKAVAAGKGEQLACATSAAGGTYSLSLPYTGDVVIEATGGTYTDEATGASKPLADPLQVVVASQGGTTTGMITPLTTIAFSQAKAAAGGVSSASFAAAATTVAGTFQLGTVDIRTATPVVSGTSVNAYGQVLRAVSQFQAGGGNLASLLAWNSPANLQTAFATAYSAINGTTLNFAFGTAGSGSGTSSGGSGTGTSTGGSGTSTGGTPGGTGTSTGGTGTSTGGSNTGGTVANCLAPFTALTYSGNAGLYASGQKVCFAATPLSLAVGDKVLATPVPNPAVTAPYAEYKFTDASTGYVYAAVFNNNVLHEINVLNGSTFVGQFTGSGTSTGTGTGSTGSGTGGTTTTDGSGLAKKNLTVTYSVPGLASGSVNVGLVPAPTTQAEFCGELQKDATLASIAASGGGAFTVKSCSFSGGKGNVEASLSLSAPVSMTLQYSILYTYQ